MVEGYTKEACKCMEIKEGELIIGKECLGCGMCERFCPDAAIEVIKNADAGE